MISLHPFVSEDAKYRIPLIINVSEGHEIGAIVSQHPVSECFRHIFLHHFHCFRTCFLGFHDDNDVSCQDFGLFVIQPLLDHFEGVHMPFCHCSSW